VRIWYLSIFGLGGFNLVWEGVSRPQHALVHGATLRCVLGGLVAVEVGKTKPHQAQDASPSSRSLTGCSPTPNTIVLTNPVSLARRTSPYRLRRHCLLG